MSLWPCRRCFFVVLELYLVPRPSFIVHFHTVALEALQCICASCIFAFGKDSILVSCFWQQEEME